MKRRERCDGYIWGAYVQPAYRRQGIATQLTKKRWTFKRTRYYRVLSPMWC
nr:GNAT family N-acetyltransferase [Anabaena catenula]